jgi:hypothetical protein
MTTTTLRPELDLAGMPDRMRRLPIDRGYVVPWFVDWVDGKPEFRAMDPKKWKRAIQESLCWVCGGILGRHRTFVIGPMCAINRTTSEPPNHTDCATWSANNCPFLSRPTMVRREDDFSIEGMKQVAGEMIPRNPGVTLLWTTKTYHVHRDHNGRPLIELGDPTAVAWYREGRLATRAEILESIETGLPLLLAACDREIHQKDRDLARAELVRRRVAVEQHLPC